MTISSLETVQDAFTSRCQQFETSFYQGDAEGLGSLQTEDARNKQDFNQYTNVWRYHLDFAQVGGFYFHAICRYQTLERHYD